MRSRLIALLVFPLCLFAEEADLILHHGKIVTVDDKFSIAEAIAVRGERIVAVGKDDEVLKTKGEKTQVIDLGGKMVLPGLMDSHVHPSSAAMHEFDHPILALRSPGDRTRIGNPFQRGCCRVRIMHHL